MNGNTAEVQRWITTAKKLLASRDFHGTRTFAIRARESAPLIADQILAVTDTLLTAQANPHDWYGILQIVPLTQSMEVAASQYRKLAILLNPAENTFSFADQAFRFVSEAWDVLSNPSKKLIYDNELRFAQFGQVSQLNQLGQLNQQHYHHQQHPQSEQLHHYHHQQQLQQPQSEPQTQMLFMQQAPQRETQSQITQSLFGRSPSRSSNNKDGNAELEGRGQLGLNNTPPAEPAWTRQINQLGLNEPSQIKQLGLNEPSQINQTGPSYIISWPEPTRTTQINRPEPIRASQVNQSGASNSSQFTLTEPTRTDQINHTTSPPPPPATAAPTTVHSQAAPTRTGPINQTTSPLPATAAPTTVHSQAAPTRTGPINQTTSPLPATAAPTTVHSQSAPTRTGPINQTSPPPPPAATMGHSQAGPTRTAPINHTASPPPAAAAASGHSQAEPTGVTRKTDSTRPNQTTGPEGPSFWTACPYCYVLYEYPKAYVDCTLRCQTKDCRRAFHAVVIPSPPLNGKDTYFSSWGFYPLGCSGNAKHIGGKFHNWSPFSPMFSGSNNKNAGKQKDSKESAPRVFYDENNVYVEISDSES